MLTPTCKQLASGQCTAVGADPGVFALSAMGAGRLGTSCGGMPFSITLIDPIFGTSRFEPQPAGTHVVLAGFGAACVIDFTFDVMTAPTGDQNPSVAGNQTAQATEHTQFAGPMNPGALSNFARGTSNDTTILPALTTNASANTSLGAGTLTDVATVTGRFDPQPGATITFRLFGPADATCSGTPLFTSTPVTYPVAGGPVTSPAFTPTQPGMYRWIASYSGDANNLPISGACNDANESTVVAQATPSITTNASPDVTLSAGSLTDVAIVSGRVNPQPGATITFTLFGPGDATCSGAPVFTSAPVSYPAAGGPVTSPAFTPTQPGRYRWVASYSGDANNASVTGLCNAANETVDVDKATPSITTNASANITLSAGSLTDVAIVSGRVNPQPGATITFTLFGPGDATCSGAPVFTSASVTYPVAGGPVTSPAFTPTQPGTYRWIASYSGDANNESVEGLCNDANETVDVDKVTPTITTNASANVTLSAGSLTDVATVSGRVNPQPGATITFTLFGPGDATCSGTPEFTSAPVTYPVAGGPVTSPAFTPASAGTYRWVASYSGDAYNAPVEGLCNDANETVDVDKVTPTITTAASPDITLGAGQLTDTAIVDGRVNPQPGATITFTLFGPGDATCSTAMFTSAPVTYPVAGGPVTSPAFTPTEPGTYHWVASYSGDANNVPVAGACNEAMESTNVASGPPPTPPPAAAVVATPPAPATTPPPSPRLPSSGIANISSGGHTGCAGKPFRVNVTGTKIGRVVFSLDGKRISTLTKRNGGNRFSVLIKPLKLKRGSHRVVAKVTYLSSAQTSPKTMRVVFSRCARAQPQFTG